MAAALAASGAALSGDDDLFNRTNPFDKNLVIPANYAKRHPKFGSFFTKHYGFSRGEKSDQSGGGSSRIGWRLPARSL